MTEDVWDEMVEKYGIHGYDKTCVTINYETLIELKEKAEKWDELKDIVPKLEERLRLLDKLEAVTEWFVENGPFHCDVHDLIGLRKILEAKG